jgi:hypothetical protein
MALIIPISTDRVPAAANARIAADQGTHHLVIAYSSSLRSKVYQSRLEKKWVTDPRQ